MEIKKVFDVGIAKTAWTVCKTGMEERHVEGASSIQTHKKSPKKIDSKYEKSFDKKTERAKPA
jgi:hypothetical protein